MGLRTREIHALSVPALLAAVTAVFFLMAALPLPAQDITSGSYTVFKRYIFPRYNDDNEIQYIIYGATAVNKGSLIYLTTPMIDIVDGSFSSLRQIDTIDGKDLYPEAYKLGSEKKLLRRFWSSSHHKHSQAWVFAEKATFDKSTNILSSDELAHFRSRQLDADGIGFDAYNDRKFIHIRSNVRVVLRLKGNSLDAEDPAPTTSKQGVKQ